MSDVLWEKIFNTNSQPQCALYPEHVCDRDIRPMSVVCVRSRLGICDRFPVEAIINNYTEGSDAYDAIRTGIVCLKEKTGKTSVVDVWGDGNCLIYSVIFSLYHTRDSNSFFAILNPFCDENATSFLLNDPSALLHDHAMMQRIAANIRQFVINTWDYIGSPEFHMNEHAIDGCAVMMVMRLLGVNRLVAYTIHRIDDDAPMEQYTIDTRTHDLRPEITTKWNVSLVCTCGYDHYMALLP